MRRLDLLRGKYRAGLSGALLNPLGAGEIRASLFQNSPNFFSSSIVQTFPASGDFFQNEQVFFSAVIANTSGPQGISGSLFQNQSEFFAASALGGARDIGGVLFQNAPTFHGATVANAAFTPLELTPSLWIDPSDTSTMFQLITGATAVTDGSVCGHAGDKSGNARHLTAAANDTTRPTWNNNAGFPYLNFDGVNDCLRRTAALGLYAGASGNTILIAVRSNNPTTQKVLLADGNTADTDTVYGIISNATTQTTMDARITNDAAGPVANIQRTSCFAGSDLVIGFTDDLSTITTYVDQTAGTPTGYTRTGVLSPNRFSLGAVVTSITTGFFVARVYGVIIVPRVLTATERANAITWLAARQNRVI